MHHDGGQGDVILGSFDLTLGTTYLGSSCGVLSVLSSVAGVPRLLYVLGSRSPGAVINGQRGYAAMQSKAREMSALTTGEEARHDQYNAADRVYRQGRVVSFGMPS
jgi:hypothetical protein